MSEAATPAGSTGVVEALFVTPAAGAPMVAVPAADGVVGGGLRGDRYAERRGHWASDPCQVTLIAAEALEAVAAHSGVALDAGQHRRNVVTRGVDLAALAGWTLRIGAVRLAYRKPRPPCAYLEGLTEPGMRAALGDRAGICADVVEGGRIHRGAAIACEADADAAVSRRRRTPPAGVDVDAAS